MTPPKAPKGEATTPTGLPEFLVVGQAKGGRRNGHIGQEHLSKLFDWWNSAQAYLKETGLADLDVPALKLASEFGLGAPTNGHSFRGNLQRPFDELEVEGKTMFVSLRGCPRPKFKVEKDTMVWFRTVPIRERRKVQADTPVECPDEGMGEQSPRLNQIPATSLAAWR